MIDERVMAIADAALEGKTPSREGVTYLLGFDPYSVEAAYVNTRARELGERACGGIGLIEGQIGVDANPCPMDCRYCSFASANSSALDPALVEGGGLEVPLDDIVRYARVLDENGVHLISLMATAALPFERYLEMVSAVRDAIADDQIILANMRDVSLEEARALKNAGADAFYHACRCGEGTLTRIAPEQRHRTMRIVREAGLSLMCGVEPLWEEVPRDELAERIVEIPGLSPFCTGVCGLSSLPVAALSGATGSDEASSDATLSGAADSDSALSGFTPASRAFIKYVAAIVRLVCGTDVPFGGVGGAVWVDVGCDPRSRGKGSSVEWIERDIRRARRDLIRDGWTVPSRPDTAWLV